MEHQYYIDRVKEILNVRNYTRIATLGISRRIFEDIMYKLVLNRGLNLAVRDHLVMRFESLMVRKPMTTRCLAMGHWICVMAHSKIRYQRY